VQRLEDPRVHDLLNVPQHGSDDGGVNLGCGGSWELWHGPQVPKTREVWCGRPPSDTPNRGGEGASQQEMVLGLWLSTVGAFRGLNNVPVV
jgi:hypothetical protein